MGLEGSVKVVLRASFFEPTTIRRSSKKSFVLVTVLLFTFQIVQSANILHFKSILKSGGIFFPINGHKVTYITDIT